MNFVRALLTVTPLLVFAAGFWHPGCGDVAGPLLGDDGDDVVDPVGRIVMRQTGGFAGISRTITIEEDGDAIVISREGDRFDPNQGPVTREGTRQALDALWSTLEAKEVFSLPTNHELLAMVADAFFYEVTVERGDSNHRFSVYAPDMLIERGDARYDAVVRAIEEFATSSGL
jgi:hypothetical protein